MYYRNPIKIMCTTRLNDGIFRVHRFSVVTPARLHKSDFVFRFYVYGGTFDSSLGYLLSARGTAFGALCADGFFWICWDYWCDFCLCFGLCSLGWRTTVQ
jgi:hypothetical protein